MLLNTIRRRWTAPGGYREVLVLAVPLVLSTGAWSIQHFVDRMFLAWHSPTAIAAAMPAGMLNYSIMCLFIGTASYVSAFVAQYHGAGRYHRIGPVMWQGLYVAALGGVIMLGLIPLAEPAFHLVGHAPEIRQLEIAYFKILCLGGLPAIAGAALSGLLAGMGHAWPVMWVNIAATGVNVVLDYGLIFGRWGLPPMGMPGAAVATVLASFFAWLIYMLIVCSRDYNRIYHTLGGWRPEKGLLLRLLRFGFPNGVEFFFDMLVFTMFVLLVGRLGTVSLAATNIAFNINTLAFMPMLGTGMAVSVLVGQYLGRDQPELAQKSTYSGFHMTFMYMLAIASAYVLVPRLFLAPFAAYSDPREFNEILTLAVTLLKFVALYSVFDAMNIIFAAAIKGAGDTRFVMFMMAVLSVFVMVLPTYWAVGHLQNGLMAAWVFATAFIILLGFSFFLRFAGGKWKTMRVIERPLPDLCSDATVPGPAEDYPPRKDDNIDRLTIDG